MTQAFRPQASRRFEEQHAEAEAAVAANATHEQGRKGLWIGDVQHARKANVRACEPLRSAASVLGSRATQQSNGTVGFHAHRVRHQCNGLRLGRVRCQPFCEPFDVDPVPWGD